MDENQELAFFISKVVDVNNPVSITIRKMDLNNGTQNYRRPVKENGRQYSGGGGIRTHEPLRDGMTHLNRVILSPARLTGLRYPSSMHDLKSGFISIIL